MESNRSAGSHITPTSSGSSRGDLGESEIVREFTSSLGRARAASPMDVITAPELTDKNLSNHIALSRHFDHLRHEQPTVGTPVLAVDPRTATAGEAPPSGSGDTDTPQPGPSSRDQRPEVQAELASLRGQAATTMGRRVFEPTPPSTTAEASAAVQPLELGLLHCPMPPECTIHLDDSEGLALTPMCRHCEFHSYMTFTRSEAMLESSSIVRQVYVDSLREGGRRLRLQDESSWNGETYW